MLTNEERLIDFARATLMILESDAAWSADTTDAIANEAYARDLAHSDDNSFFRVNPYTSSLF